MGARGVIAGAAGVAVAACGSQALAAGTAASPKTYSLPPGTLKLSDARLQASAGEQVTFTVRLSGRAVAKGRLDLTLPRQWTGRSGVSGLRYTKAPNTGSASSERAKVSRTGRVVRFAFAQARQGDSARYTVTDRGLPARAYSLRYAWREERHATKRGTAKVTVFVTPRPPR